MAKPTAAQQRAFDAANRNWKRAVEEYAKVSSIVLFEDIINKRAVNLGFHAGRFTPRAKLGKWPLNRTAKPGVKRKRWNDRNNLFYRIANKAGTQRGKGIEEAALAIYNRRRSAKGAIAWGFIKPAKELALKTRQRPSSARTGGHFRKYGAGSVAASKGYAGNRRNKAARILNNVDGAWEKGYAAMTKAWRADSADMQVYINRKLSETAKRYSGTRNRK